jgi:hypothetical protein
MKLVVKPYISAATKKENTITFKKTTKPKKNKFRKNFVWHSTFP